MALREFLPPEPGLATRRQARTRRRRRSGPLIAGFVVVAAAATGSAAALLGSGPGGRASSDAAVAGYPSSAGTSASRAGATVQGAGGATSAQPSGDASVAATDPAGPPVMPLGTPYRGAAWPALTYTLKAVRGGMAPAPFPTAVPGYVLEDSFTTRLNVLAGKRFQVFGDLPVKNVSYQQCRRQRFFVRWQAVGSTAVIESTFVDALVRTVQNHPVIGNAGWQSSFGCVQPALRIRLPTGSLPSRAVVVAQMQVWRLR